jgi:hypothetical protein
MIPAYVCEFWLLMTAVFILVHGTYTLVKE